MSYMLTLRIKYETATTLISHFSQIRRQNMSSGCLIEIRRVYNVNGVEGFRHTNIKLKLRQINTLQLNNTFEKKTFHLLLRIFFSVSSTSLYYLFLRSQSYNFSKFVHFLYGIVRYICISKSTELQLLEDLLF